MRENEVAGLRTLGTWVEKPISESCDETGHAPIQCRWVECNKGDDENPDIRSRAVVCETKRVSNIAPDDVNSVFSATPPLEAIRAQCSLIMSLQPVDGEPIVMQFLDISKSSKSLVGNPPLTRWEGSLRVPTLMPNSSVVT